MNAGIDYGNGMTNVDHATGIRYGVISQHTVGQAWYDSAEAQYGDPICPKCGRDVIEASESEDDFDECEKGHGCNDFYCGACRYVFDSADAYSDEPIGWTVSADGYELDTCLDVNVFVLKAPFYTYAVFCSPCVPGAGDLDNAVDLPLDGIKAYCLGHDWFEDGKAPYRVFDVATDQEVLPPA